MIFFHLSSVRTPRRIICLLLPLALVGQARTEEEAPAVSPVSEELNNPVTQELKPPAAAPYLTLALEMIEECEKLANVLDGVINKPTADAAAASIAPTIQALCELVEKQKSIQSPSPEVVEYVNAKLKTYDVDRLSERSLGKVIDLLTLTDPPCYGSAEMNALLNKLSKVLMDEQR